jgi:hypothetical protein
MQVTDRLARPKGVLYMVIDIDGMWLHMKL